MNLQEKFSQWMLNSEKKSQNTVNAYLSGVRQIQKHYNTVTMDCLDFFNCTKNDVSKITYIEKDYDAGGVYAEIGEAGKRTYINGLVTYIRFLNYWFSEENNHIVEADLQKSYSVAGSTLKTLFMQKISSTFHGFTVYEDSSNSSNIILQNAERKELLAIVLKSDIAKVDSFGEVCSIMGKLSDDNSSMKIRGAIIANEFDQMLINACKTNPNIILKKYKLDLHVSDAQN